MLYEKELAEDNRTTGEVISDIRKYLTELDVILSMIHDDLDILRLRNDK